MPRFLQCTHPIITATLLAAFLTGGSTAVFAQRVALTLYGAAPPNSVVVYNLTTGRTESSRVGTLTAQTVFTADGRYALWTRGQSSSGDALELYDTATRTAQRLPYAFQAVAAHPRQAAVFGLVSGGNVARIDLAGFHSAPVCGADIAVGLDVTVDGARLVVACSTNPFLPDPIARIVVVDAVTGQQLQVSDLGIGRIGSIASNSDASQVLVVKALSSNAAEVSLVDIAAAQITTLFVDSPFPSGTVAGGCNVIGVSAGHEAAGIHCSWTDFTSRVERTELIGLETAQRRVLTAVPGAGSMHFSPDMSTAIVTSEGLVQFLDVASDTVVQQVSLNAGVAGAAWPPASPQGVAAGVNGGHVTIHWTLPAYSPDVTGYILEAGTSPGASNIATMMLGPQTEVTVPGVPAGRYYVRLRATNFSGTGDASEELVVDVP